MTELPPAHEIRRHSHGALADVVSLSYDGRLLRRRRLETDGGAAFLVDLPQTVSLDHGDAFLLGDGRLIGVVAAEEDLLAVTAAPADMARVAWHIGNRHAPAQFEPDPPRIVIQRDAVMGRMLAGIGATIHEVREPFTPEGGAYGHGRTMGHSHDHPHAHDHAHDHAQTHDHPHSHDHDHTHDH
ncbi:urease accessory protein UreE [Roseisalinus antarcticus]|uniref:Urease accessory protein UreE n=1 Tax=Roseisalinus antarcticus TaxID=254357 RepID=A0A1Y5SYP5_9RHOB|nr:urease accessory protein UreE [Roseisalinus antarcticus]SLN51997.1 Urease accessory protein UreE 1 [Roseisalinus antarcticus]